eukprot:1047294-Lingulodinium_polyedra.AAC.1
MMTSCTTSNGLHSTLPSSESEAHCNLDEDADAGSAVDGDASCVGDAQMWDANFTSGSAVYVVSDAAAN